jgi:hypothetical protein
MTFGAFNMILMCGISGLGNSIIGPIFSIDTKDFTMPTSTFTNLTYFNTALRADVGTSSNNISAASLQLADKYSFYMWSYSSTTGSDTNYSSFDFDYINKINISTITTTDGLIIEVPQSLADLKRNLRKKLLFAEAGLIAAALNCFIVLSIGIAACFPWNCHVFFSTVLPSSL